ncbi:hypothetical protein BO99DRAFT_153626 [Aspergillus violaceofuscus CBS 115571]|uniref:Uncharacterized protein n=1 Tax=Aspergillus violaceofuscus (strain CBS 115571) TaxID=1450538 RepID=A0A2V5HQB5_ASPV1|nr:hypothetical protein BO99DRAFT_153626 [Aspergillus violaceofuscus CBS 115571]
MPRQYVVNIPTSIAQVHTVHAHIRLSKLLRTPTLAQLLKFKNSPAVSKLVENGAGPAEHACAYGYPIQHRSCQGQLPIAGMASYSESSIWRGQSCCTDPHLVTRSHTSIGAGVGFHSTRTLSISYRRLKVRVMGGSLYSSLGLHSTWV